VYACVDAWATEKPRSRPEKVIDHSRDWMISGENDATAVASEQLNKPAQRGVYSVPRTALDS
jgi:hypothetical protein